MIRAVALSDSSVQQKLGQFIPLKVEMKRGAKEYFPLNWPALRTVHDIYPLFRNVGYTGISVVSPDLQVEYGNGGSGAIFNLFDSKAYDKKKCSAMLDLAAKRFAREQEIRTDKTLSPQQRDQQLGSFRADVRRILDKEGTVLPPPNGFTIEGALELSELAGRPVTPKKK